MLRSPICLGSILCIPCASWFISGIMTTEHTECTESEIRPISDLLTSDFRLPTSFIKGQERNSTLSRLNIFTAQVRLAAA